MLGLLPVSLQPARFVGVEVDHLPPPGATAHHFVPPHAVQHAVVVAQSMTTLQQWAQILLKYLIFGQKFPNI